MRKPVCEMTDTELAIRMSELETLPNLYEEEETEQKKERGEYLCSLWDEMVASIGDVDRVLWDKLSLEALGLAEYSLTVTYEGVQYTVKELIQFSEKKLVAVCEWLGFNFIDMTQGACIKVEGSLSEISPIQLAIYDLMLMVLYLESFR